MTILAVGENVLAPAQNAINEQIQTVHVLSKTASKHPFYKWNSLWSREVQNLVRKNSCVADSCSWPDEMKIFYMQFKKWLQSDQLLSLENVGESMDGTKPMIAGRTACISGLD